MKDFLIASIAVSAKDYYEAIRTETAEECFNNSGLW